MLLLIVFGEELNGGGDKLLSVGGKEIHIKVVVQSIPSYSMILFCLPKSLILDMHRLCARFWWGRSLNKRKIHWCVWSRLCKFKMEGGLGFRDLETFNRALLTKQCWRILKNPESLAARVLKDNYFRIINFLDTPKKSSTSFV